ncbi:unnamed protein product [Trichobilharzia szidati]|nr:unnamed protein product [Trichobilharzia szidati]
MLYRKCCALIQKEKFNFISRAIGSYYRNDNHHFELHNVGINNSNNNKINKRLCQTIACSPTESPLPSPTISSTWLRSQYLSDTVLQQEFSDVYTQNTLKNLLALCQDEFRLGRWRKSKISISDENSHDKKSYSSSLLDSLFLDLYKTELNIDPVIGVQMVRNVCRNKLEQNFCIHTQNFDHLRIRLDLLNPDLLLVRLYDPLTNIGVKHVNRLIERCPELPLGTMPCITSNQDNSLSYKTILQESLEVLSHYLIHNDVINVVQRFPSVLLRGKLELIDLCEFCIHEMRLESFDYIRALSSPHHKHSLRHSTGLSISKCPIWELPLEHVRARFTFLRLAGCWPLTRYTVGKSINVDQQLATLLKSSDGEFSSWLNVNLGKTTLKSKDNNNNNTSEKSNTLISGIVFTKSDIQFFEKVYSRISTDSENEDDIGIGDTNIIENVGDDNHDDDTSNTIVS